MRGQVLVVKGQDYGLDARPFLQAAPHLVLVPGLVLFRLIFGFNSLGEGIESWLSPWKQPRTTVCQQRPEHASGGRPAPLRCASRLQPVWLGGWFLLRVG